MIYLGIDPGLRETGYALVTQDYGLEEAGKYPNDAILRYIKNSKSVTICIESLQSYGQAVGKEVFETAYVIGRIIQICDDYRLRYYLYARPEYARAICGVQRITDAVLWQALKLRFGGDRKGEPLHLLKGATDKRSAYAVAVYHIDRQKYKGILNCQE
jgi:hypothetical protein